MLDLITPVILTFNEENNIGRSLNMLRWAKRVVVVDSGSTDQTLEIAHSFKNVSIYDRPFDTHAEQWNYAIEGTEIDTDWVLRLDADYILTQEVIHEISGLQNVGDVEAFEISFRYAINGRILRSSLYPPNKILFRHGKQSIIQAGHSERWFFAGNVQRLVGKVIHDDRKSLRRWFESQIAYASQEAYHLLDTANADLSLVQRLRKAGLPAPLVNFIYVLFFKGVIFDGRAGWFYALQRLLAEVLIALELMDRRSRVDQKPTPTS